MNRRELLDGFQFHYQPSLNYQIGPEPLVQSNSREFNRHWNLPRHTEASIL